MPIFSGEKTVVISAEKKCNTHRESAIFTEENQNFYRGRNAISTEKKCNFRREKCNFHRKKKFI